MQKDRDEDEKSQRRANLESTHDCNTIDERVKQKSSERRHAHRLRHFVHFLTEMEMRNERVLREVNQKEAE